MAIGDSPWATRIASLRCLRGIDTLTAAGLKDTPPDDIVRAIHVVASQGAR